jgi:hypothetical protein
MNFREINTQHYVDLIQLILDEMQLHKTYRPDGCVCAACCEIRNKRCSNLNDYSDEQKRTALKSLREITKKRCSQLKPSYLGVKPTNQLY